MGTLYHTDNAVGTAPDIVTGAAVGTAPGTAESAEADTAPGTAESAATGTAPGTAESAATGTAPSTAESAATDTAPGTAASAPEKRRVLTPPVFWLIIVNAVLYTLFLIMDIYDIRLFSSSAIIGERISSELYLSSAFLKYVSICVCFAISQVVLLRTSRERDARLQVLIFGFTLIADYFLLFTDYYVTGMIIFCAAHVSAILRYSNMMIVKLVAGLALIIPAVPIAASLISWTMGSGSSDGDSPGAYFHEVILLAVGLYYSALIIAATIATFVRRQPHVNNILSRLGMILFVLCDINVLILNLSNFGGPGELATEPPYPAHIIAWVFYLPAQTMLAISAYDFEKSKRAEDQI
ncbi:MAG: hypothetical protein LBT52_04125 [Clostridiales Family XIII bacterium]|jgi:predicted secreted protein|nr:hypothetical protein [Clostridiales Family XIII bacterium]